MTTFFTSRRTNCRTNTTDEPVASPKALTFSQILPIDVSQLLSGVAMEGDERRQPNFVKIASLRPDTSGHNIIVKVFSRMLN